MTTPPTDHALRTMKLASRLHRWAAARVQASHLGRELSLRQLAMLYAIREGLSSPGQIARRLRVTPAVITGLLDRLEQRGYVRREAAPGDRRRLRLLLTETGAAMGQEVQDILTQDMAAQLATASSAELEELGRALDLLDRALGALEGHTPAPIATGADEDEATWEDLPRQETPASSRGPARAAAKAAGRKG